MIIDTTQTRIQRKLYIADIQAQLTACANDPNLRFISELVFDYETRQLYSRTRILATGENDERE